MSDTDDSRDVTDIEALLAELEIGELELADPPPEIWAGIEARTAGSAPVVELAARRRPVVQWAMAGAAALVLVVGGAIVLASRDSGGSNGDVLSSAVLMFDPAGFDPRGSDSSATAELVERDGTFEIRLRDVDLPTLDGDDLELWLIEPDADGNPLDVAPVAVVEAAGSGTYEVPAGLDPDSHYVVDISIEPRDGVATHSGQSILRGALTPE